MLGKLIKHEFKATAKTFALLFAATIVLTVLTRFTDYIPANNIVLRLFIALVVVSCCILIFGGIIMAFISMIRRYYDNMMKDEGYLTHTLPVKIWQHIVTKLVTDLVWMIASLVVTAISLIILAIGTDSFDKFLKGFNEFINVVGDNPRLIVYIVITILLLIMQFIVNLLCIFAAISLGQIFAKHKMFGAVLFWCLLNYAMGILTSVFMYLAPNFVDEMNQMDAEIATVTTVSQYLDLYNGVIIKLFMLLLVLELIMGTVYFIITNVMMEKKLNLE